MKIDVLAFAAHPDDAELSCSGTLMKLASQGKTIGIVDLTKGELGTRGNAEIRAKESAAAAEILGLSVRENLDLGDGFFEESESSLKSVIRAIRKYQPEIILCNAVDDRHPDHARGSQLVSRASFLSGLKKIDTTDGGKSQSPWRAKNIYHYIQFRYIKPDFVVDIAEFMDRKLEAISAFKSQFYDPNSTESPTMISSKKFFEYVSARAREMGAGVEVEFGEGFTSERPLKIKDLFDLQ